MGNSAANSVRCHICGSKAVTVFPQYQTFHRVTSDCKAWRPGGRMSVCNECGCAQAVLDQTWHEEAKQIYDAYTIYHQSKGIEQSVFDQASGQATSRSSRLLQRLQAEIPLPEKGRLMDIGCGNGALLSAFSGLSLGWSLAGVEVNDHYRSVVESITGVEQLFTCSPEEVPGRFQLISLMHALEHIPSPREFIVRLWDKLEIGGLLLIQVPDCAQNPFMFLVADHASHFFVSTLKELVQSAGYEVLVAANDWVAKEITVVAQRRGERASPDENRKDATRRHAPHEPPHPNPLSLGGGEGAQTAGEGEVQGFNVRIGPGKSLPGDGLRAGVDPFRMVNERLQWLSRQLETARPLAKEGNFGLFGTSIAATWLFAELNGDVGFFVDEDPHRIGQTCFGRPIYPPGDAPADSYVFIALPTPLAAAVKHRLERQGLKLRFEIPGPLPSV